MALIQASVWVFLTFDSDEANPAGAYPRSRIRVLGLDPLAERAALRSRMGILLQRSGSSGDLTVVETLPMWHSTVSQPSPSPTCSARCGSRIAPGPASSGSPAANTDASTSPAR